MRDSSRAFLKKGDMLGFIKADSKVDDSAVDEQPRVGKNPGVDGWLLGALYLSELSLLLILLTSYVVQRKPSFLSFLNSRPGYVFLTGIAGLLVSGKILRRRCTGPAKADVRSARLTVAMNLVSVFLLFIIGEGTIRAFFVETTMGDKWGSAYLLPREWTKVVGHYQESFRLKFTNPPYAVYHEVLGWTIGLNRSSQDKRYFSSVEGLRSPRAGIAFADRHPVTRIGLNGCLL